MLMSSAMSILFAAKAFHDYVRVSHYVMLRGFRASQQTYNQFDA